MRQMKEGAEGDGNKKEMGKQWREGSKKQEGKRGAENKIKCLGHDTDSHTNTIQQKLILYMRLSFATELECSGAVEVAYVCCFSTWLHKSAGPESLKDYVVSLYCYWFYISLPCYWWFLLIFLSVCEEIRSCLFHLVLAKWIRLKTPLVDRVARKIHYFELLPAKPFNSDTSPRILKGKDMERY